MLSARILLPFLVALAACCACAGAAVAAEPRVARPASTQAVAACGARAAEQRATADLERVVRGVGALGGCATDAAGIEHLFVEWTRPGEHRATRICADPPVRASAWRCQWDTRALEPGSYVVRMTAVDVAGNRGVAEQAYRVEAAPATDVQPVPRPEPTPAPGAAAEPAPQPTEPVAPTEPGEPTPATEPTEPVEPAAPGGAPPVLVPTPAAQLVHDRLAECAELELAPGVAADRALSVAVLDCLRPALDALGAQQLALDEIPVPPSIRIRFADAASLDAADELLPDRVGGVGLELELELAAGPEVDDQDAPATPPTPAS